MAITRSPRPESNFYILDKQISEDKRLSWSARGLLIFLLGKPDNWTVSIQALINETTQAERPTKRCGLYEVIKELVSVGYITRRKHQSGEMDYFVHETPKTDEFAKSEKPDLEKPDLEKPDLANQTLVSTDVVVRNQKAVSIENKQSAAAPVFKAKDALLAKEVTEQTAADWIAFRKGKRAAISQTAIDAIEREAAKAGMSLDDVLQTCCARGWIGFQASWVSGDRRQDNKGHNPERRQSDLDALNRANNEAAKRLVFGNDDSEAIDV